MAEQYLQHYFFLYIFGNYIINKLHTIQPSGQPIRNDGPQSHIIAKKGTPTMGGLLIILSVLISTILWGDLSNNFVWIANLTIIILGLLDLLMTTKIKTNNATGIFKVRIIFQIIFALFITYLIIINLDTKISNYDFSIFEKFNY